MKNKGFLLFFAIFVLLGVLPAGAQQEGSVAIAGSIRPADDATLSDFTECVVTLKGAGMKPEAAVKACTKVASIAANTATRIANEAADATKASRPVVVSPYGYGGGYYRSYGYDGYYSGRSSYRSYGHRSHPRVHREARPHPPQSRRESPQRRFSPHR